MNSVFLLGDRFQKSKDLLTKVKKKIQKFKQHKNGAPKQATLHLKFQMVAVRR